MDEIMSFSGNEVLVGEPIARNYSNNGIKKKLYFVQNVLQLSKGRPPTRFYYRIVRAKVDKQ